MKKEMPDIPSHVDVDRIPDDAVREDSGTNSRHLGDSVDGRGSRGPSEGFSRSESYDDGGGRGGGGWDGL